MECSTRRSVDQSNWSMEITWLGGPIGGQYSACQLACSSGKEGCNGHNGICTCVFARVTSNKHFCQTFSVTNTTNNSNHYKREFIFI